MYKTKLNKIGNLIEQIKNDINLSIISDFLEWFYEKLELHFTLNNNNQYLKFNKGDIYFVKLGKNIGSELNKNRPCIIYSGFYFNGGNNLIIIPLKSYKGKINKRIHVFLGSSKFSFLKKDSIVEILGIKQISKKRIGKKIGHLDNVTLEKIDTILLKSLEIKKEK